MKSFSVFLSEVVGYESGHMTHIEDLVFDLGVSGTRKAIYFLRDVRDMLTIGSSNKKSVLTVKFDGAPAVFCGINPENNRFFVAKKGIFNKNPKLYYSKSDIDADTKGDLASKLKIAFDECSKLGITKGVYQGDIMFTKSDLKSESIDGKSYITFHPNTIVYAVPSDTALAAKIKRSNIGIVWHTTYTGSSISTLTPTFGKGIVSKFKNSTSSWMIDATYEDVGGIAMFTDAERTAFDALLTAIGKKFQKMSADALNDINKNPDLLAIIRTYNNSKIRAGESIKNVGAHVNGLIDMIKAKYAAEIASRKTPTGKQNVSAKQDSVLSFFSKYDAADIRSIFELSVMLNDAKKMLIAKLNMASQLNTFVKTKNGFRVTGTEGFVAISDEGAVKLVDRLEFSMANFSPEIIKGWEH